jgi:hypothetical protein
VQSANGGSVLSVSGPEGGRFLRFPGEPCAAAPCPQAVIVPPGAEGLTGAGAFTFGADMRLTSRPSSSAGMNVMQSGAAAEGQHQWKLQVDYGYPACRWSDGRHVVLLGGEEQLPEPLDVGVWYDVRCARLSATSFEMRIVDNATGRPVRDPLRQSAGMDAITPADTVTIGGKTVNAAHSDADTDQYHGDLDHIFFAD